MKYILLFSFLIVSTALYAQDLNARVQILAPQMADSRFEPVKWHVRTLLKDLDTAMKFSREQGSATPISGLAAQLMRLHGGQGFLEKDPSTLVQLYREPDSSD